MQAAPAGLNWATKRKAADDPWLEFKRFAKPEGLEMDFSQSIADGPTTQGFDYFHGIPGSLDMPYAYVENDRATELASARRARIRDGGVFWLAALLQNSEWVLRISKGVVPPGYARVLDEPS